MDRRRALTHILEYPLDDPWVAVRDSKPGLSPFSLFGDRRPRRGRAGRYGIR